MQPLFFLHSIRYAYPGRAAPILDGASLTVEPGQRLGLLGGNGSGKSTLLHIGAGLIRPDAGAVTHQGTECRTEADFVQARARLGYLLQHAEDHLFCSTVLEDVAFGPYNQGKSARESAEMAYEALAALDLTSIAEFNGRRLSGGEQKLAALASVLVMRPEFLFLDEPTNDLDADARERLITAIARSGLPAVVISHDWDFLSRICTRFCLLEHGRIADASLEAHSHVHAHPGGDATHGHGDIGSRHLTEKHS
jgi:cobalt/nickel transport system ATP-binding protein